MNLFTSPMRMRQLAPLTLVLLSATAAVGAFLQALDSPFVFDDTSYTTENSKLLGLHLSELWRIFFEPYNEFGEFLPLRDLSYWFDINIFGITPSALRLHNILLYLLCLPLVYATTFGVWRYFRPADSSAPWAAAAVTALFALHPAQVEAVVWISSRKYVLPNLFSMLSLWLAVSAKREQGLSVPHASATLVAFVAVMLSKPSYVAVAPVIAMLWMSFWRDIPTPNRRNSMLLWPLAILLLAAFQFLIFIAASGGSGATGMPFYFGVEAITRSLAVLGWLVRLAVSPESRHYFYPVFEDTYLPFRVVLGVAALAAAIGGGVMLLRKRSLEGFVLASFLLLCMPYIHLIPYLAPSLVQDRYLSLALWPVILLIVALSWRLNPVPRTALLLIIALAWGFQTMERPRDWRNFEAIIDADLRTYPGYYMPAMYKVINQYTHGLTREAVNTASSIKIQEFRDVAIGLIKANHVVTDAIATGKPQEAIALLQKLWLDHKQLPVQAKWNSPVKNLWITKENMLATEWMRLAAFFPDDITVRYNAGLALLSIKEYKNAATYLRAAAESQNLPEPVRGTAFYNLGLALMKSGQVAEAEARLHAALQQSPPELLAHCALSEVYKQTRRVEEAAHAMAKCPERMPNGEAAR